MNGSHEAGHLWRLQMGWEAKGQLLLQLRDDRDSWTFSFEAKSEQTGVIVQHVRTHLPLHTNQVIYIEAISVAWLPQHHRSANKCLPVFC